jgi:hypothetical protein
LTLATPIREDSQTGRQPELSREFRAPGRSGRVLARARQRGVRTRSLRTLDSRSREQVIAGGRSGSLTISHTIQAQGTDQVKVVHDSFFATHQLEGELEPSNAAATSRLSLLLRKAVLTTQLFAFRPMHLAGGYRSRLRTRELDEGSARPFTTPWHRCSDRFALGRSRFLPFATAGHRQ